MIYSALIPNEKGLDRAISAGVDKISVFTAVSETFNRKNINASVEASIQLFRPLVKRAHNVGLPARGYVSTESVVKAFDSKGEVFSRRVNGIGPWRRIVNRQGRPNPKD